MKKNEICSFPISQQIEMDMLNVLEDRAEDNMAAGAAGINLSRQGNAPTHLEEFSVMALRLCQKAVDMTHLSAIGRLAAAEYRKRYEGQKPQQQLKQVNGGLHPVNVYSEKDREWVEDIVKNYITNIPEPKSETTRKCRG